VHGGDVTGERSAVLGIRQTVIDTAIAATATYLKMAAIRPTEP
jgi:hypothetical protein